MFLDRIGYRACRLSYQVPSDPTFRAMSGWHQLLFWNFDRGTQVTFQGVEEVCPWMCSTPKKLKQRHQAEVTRTLSSHAPASKFLNVEEKIVASTKLYETFC